MATSVIEFDSADRLRYVTISEENGNFSCEGSRWVHNTYWDVEIQRNFRNESDAVAFAKKFTN